MTSRVSFASITADRWNSAFKSPQISPIRPVEAKGLLSAAEHRKMAGKALVEAERVRVYIEATELPVKRRARLMLDRAYYLFLVESNLHKALLMEAHENDENPISIRYKSSEMTIMPTSVSYRGADHE